MSRGGVPNDSYLRDEIAVDDGFDFDVGSAEVSNGNTHGSAESLAG